MSLTVYIAHTGLRLAADPRKTSSIEQLQLWVSQKASIDASQQILMTARGKQVKPQTLLQETEIFVYDRQILSPSTIRSTSALVPTARTPPTFNLREPPQNSADNKTFQTWQTLFKQRRAWALELVDLAGHLVEEVKGVDAEAGIIQRSAAIAVENVKQHVGSLRPRYEESKAWADSVLKDQALLLTNWEKGLEKLAQITVVPELGRCLSGGDDAFQMQKPSKLSTTKNTLYDFVQIADVRKAGSIAKATSDRFTKRVNELANLFEDIAHDSFDVIDNFGQAVALSDSDVGDQAMRLMEEVEVVARKINADYEHILSLPNSQKSMNDMSRTALLHTRNFLPALQQTSAEIDQLLRHSIERKNDIMSSAIRYLQRVSLIESSIAQAHSQLADLDVDSDEGQSFDLLNHVIKLPLTYGLLLVESIRRREWTEKMTADSSALVEEVAVFKDEEARRRKKWAKELGEAVVLAAIDDMALGIDINLQAQKQKWPNVSRQNLTDLLQSLKRVEGSEDALRAIDSEFQTLDVPTKQQIRRAKAFKNGSVYDASFGKQSLLLRGNDELVQSLKTDNSKLEDRLKSSESRIRKLEDLLHRQNQISRPPSSHAYNGNDGPAFPRHTFSPMSNFVVTKPQESHSRRSSISSRRLPNESDERALVQRIVDLESELIAIKQDAVTNVKIQEDLKSQMQEALSTKEDLLNNMEAQQREFEEERRLIEEENGKLKIKLEEVEDEMDRMLESREHDNRVLALEEELEKRQKTAATEAQNALELLDRLRNEHTEQREKVDALQLQAQEQDEEIAQLSMRLQKRDMSAATNHRALRTVMFRLSKDSVAPEDLDSLVETIEELSQQSAAHLTEVESALENVRTDTAALEVRLISQTAEASDLKKRLDSEEMEISSLREDLAEQRRQFTAVQTELEIERSEHSQLRSKFANGEADSQSLRALLAEKEQRIADLTGKIAELEHDVQGLESSKIEMQNKHRETQQSLERTISDQDTDHKILQQKLESQAKERQAKLDELQGVHLALQEAFETRALRAEEVSVRLYNLKNSLGRLLEQVGFTISRQGNTMVFQRTSKAATASAILSEPSSMVRSVSASLPVQSAFDAGADSDLPRWTTENNPEAESQQFSTFMGDITSFESESFTEAIIKRIKDIDHTARKCFKDARAYRDKYKRIQSEAHEKITVRAFKEGDLALFLPTRNQATKPWAAFNVGYPHYFLREQDSHKLSGRDWLLARINKIEPRVVDLSRSMSDLRPSSDGASEVAVSFDDENPFELSDGLRWNLVDAAEEKLGPPMTIGSSKSTVASANVDATGSIRMKKSKDGNGATVTLTRSLDSRRNSSNSKAGSTVNTPRPTTATDSEDRREQDQVGQTGDNPAAELSQPTLSDQPKTAATNSPNKPPPLATSPSKATGSPSKAAPPSSGLTTSRKSSPEKPKSKAWDSLWSLDYSLESGKR